MKAIAHSLGAILLPVIVMIGVIAVSLATVALSAGLHQ